MSFLRRVIFVDVIGIRPPIPLFGLFQVLWSHLTPR